ncbi:MAG: NIPSNAP family protein [Rhodoferax sp.]
MAEREAKWTAFVQDPEWTGGCQRSEQNGALVSSMRNAFLQPTAFSSVR